MNKLNQNSIWRNIYGKPEDGKFKDVEVILRSFALLYDGKKSAITANIESNSAELKSPFLVANVSLGISEQASRKETNAFCCKLF